MTQGFYEQIGVNPAASTAEVKAAYGRAVARLMKRREAALSRGGDTAQLDLARAQLDEAWNVISAPARRRRYDAMLAVARDGVGDAGMSDLWSVVSGAMVHPALAAAAQLVDAVTELEIGPLPEPPRPDPAETTGSWAEEVTLSERVHTDFGAPRRPVATTAPPQMPSPSVVAEARIPPAAAPPRPTRRGAEVVDLATVRGPDLRVVETHAGAADVFELRPADHEPPTSSNEFDGLVDQLGPSGALLKAVREQRGLTLQQLADTTRVSIHFLEAIEAENFDALPSATAFVKGYVKQMARHLELDVDHVVEGYMRRYRGS